MVGIDKKKTSCNSSVENTEWRTHGGYRTHEVLHVSSCGTSCSIPGMRDFSVCAGIRTFGLGYNASCALATWEWQGIEGGVGASGKKGCGLASQKCR